MCGAMILMVALLAAEPVPVTVCLTQLWEHYDYDYEGGEGDYAEIVTKAWAVEVGTDLPNGMTGWTYVGFIRLSKILFYDSYNEEDSAWWQNKAGHRGTADSVESACEQIVQRQFGLPDEREIEIRWR